MWEGVQVLTKPVLSPLSTADAKARLRVDFADDDTLIDNFVKGAVARIDGPSGIGYALMTQTWRKTCDAFPLVTLLPGAPVKSVTEIKYLDTTGTAQTLDAADYRIDLGNEPVRVVPNIGKAWPATYNTIGAVWIDYVLGEGAAANVNADLIDAVSLMLAHRYEHREATVMGQANVLPLGVPEILAEYSRVAFAA